MNGANCKTLHRLASILSLILCFASCETASKPSRLVRPNKPIEPTVSWVHLRPDVVSRINEALTGGGEPPLPAGELLTYDEFKKLAEWVVEERGYVTDLEDAVAYYEKLP